MLLKRIDLETQLASGIVVHVKSPTDWTIYNDIFVEGEYDLPLQETFAEAESGRAIRMLDVGANVGFFSLRALHLHRLAQCGNQLEIVCIEGSSANFKELKKRVRPHAGQLQLIHGLAGERSGTGVIRQHHSHGMSSISTAAGRGVPVPYVDLARLTECWDSVDLLKCDIEGSEEALLRNYPDLLRKTRRLVLELHHHRVDVNGCRQMLRAACFKENRVLTERPWCSVEYSTRARESEG